MVTTPTTTSYTDSSLSLDTLYYSKVEQLTRLLRLCDARDLKIATATVKALLDTKLRKNRITFKAKGLREGAKGRFVCHKWHVLA